MPNGFLGWQGCRPANQHDQVPGLASLRAEVKERQQKAVGLFEATRLRAWLRQRQPREQLRCMRADPREGSKYGLKQQERRQRTSRMGGKLHTLARLMRKELVGSARRGSLTSPPPSLAARGIPATSMDVDDQLQQPALTSIQDRRLAELGGDASALYPDAPSPRPRKSPLGGGITAAPVDVDKQLQQPGPPSIEDPHMAPTMEAPGPAQRTPDAAQRTPDAAQRSPPDRKSVQGKRVFRRNAGRVCGLAREQCGPAGLLWTRSNWDGAFEAAVSGLEGLIGVPDSELLEGFGRVVASTAAAHLEGLKQRGTVRAARRARRAKVASGSPRSPRRRRGIEQLETKADPHSLCCHVCGATAVWGLRGSKGGGQVEYSCKDHDHSFGSFRIDKDRAAWVREREWRRVEAELERLEDELRKMDEESSSAEAPALRACSSPVFDEPTFKSPPPSTEPMSHALLARRENIEAVRAASDKGRRTGDAVYFQEGFFVPGHPSISGNPFSEDNDLENGPARSESEGEGEDIEGVEFQRDEESSDEEAPRDRAMLDDAPLKEPNPVVQLGLLQRAAGASDSEVLAEMVRRRFKPRAPRGRLRVLEDSSSSSCADENHPPPADMEAEAGRGASPPASTTAAVDGDSAATPPPTAQAAAAPEASAFKLGGEPGDSVRSKAPVQSNPVWGTEVMACSTVRPTQPPTPPSAGAREDPGPSSSASRPASAPRPAAAEPAPVVIHEIPEPRGPGYMQLKAGTNVSQIMRGAPTSSPPSRGELANLPKLLPQEGLATLATARTDVPASQLQGRKRSLDARSPEDDARAREDGGEQATPIDEASSSIDRRALPPSSEDEAQETESEGEGENIEGAEYEPRDGVGRGDPRGSRDD
ncbi:hypothetical protein KFL_002680140 [Klebsormidium nitens]|uniref:Uncharacterized protein n=1 Tax=Klebsormidium nitens TaxID=105231 RepID=A0A1Y1IDA3_KLENI|nr:hypothetical protein KFL_002680140 [Klebsormidium nitens]|eukprot:GAQ86068.1 hypothetical protein KFL_002680140 [Klebsormidium nitens]